MKKLPKPTSFEIKIIAIIIAVGVTALYLLLYIQKQ